MAKKQQRRCEHCGWTLNSQGYCPQCEDSHEYEAWKKAQKEKQPVAPSPTNEKHSEVE